MAQLPLKHKIRRLFRQIGIDIRKHNEPDLVDFLALYQVDAVFDIGANVGMSGESLRYSGYNKKIISFEPIQFLYNKLLIKTKKDNNWIAENFGLGDKNEKLYINVSAGTAVSNSIFEMTDVLKESAPDQLFYRKEEIEIKRLDDIIDKYASVSDRLFLKIDVQGYEKNVLSGAEKSLEKVVGIKLEMSLKRQYEGESLFDEMLDYLIKKGFTLVRIDNGWSHPVTGELYQVDGIFFKVNYLQGRTKRLLS